jgi:hypothetical protein
MRDTRHTEAGKLQRANTSAMNCPSGGRRWCLISWREHGSNDVAVLVVNATRGHTIGKESEFSWKIISHSSK